MDRILAFLGSITNSIEFHIMAIYIFRSILLHHSLLEHLTNRSGLLFVHGCLIRKTKFLQVYVWIEPFGYCIFELFHKFCFITSVEDIICDIFCFFHILYNNVVLCKRCSCYRLFVSPRAVNDASMSCSNMSVNRVPNLADPRASCIYDLHTPIAQQLHFLKCCPKSWQDHNMIFLNPTEILHAIDDRDELYSHLFHHLVHARIVNDLIGDMDNFIPIVHLGLDRHLNGSFNTPAKTEVFGKFKGDVSVLHGVHVLPHFFYQTRLEFFSHNILSIAPGILEPHTVKCIHTLNLFKLISFPLSFSLC
mmetsp:Transcript_11989/g.17874  ORF Transcript_11989/g.17874 Transcript_11989/m.17874 type:complete len:306 (-) Transcript_11989:228-1145(-)